MTLENFTEQESDLLIRFLAPMNQAPETFEVLEEDRPILDSIINKLSGGGNATKKFNDKMTITLPMNEAFGIYSTLYVEARNCKEREEHGDCAYLRRLMGRFDEAMPSDYMPRFGFIEL